MALGRGNRRGFGQPQWAVTANSRISTQSQAEVDEGLRHYMLRVYNYMAGGLAVAGLVCLALASQPELVFSLMNSGLYMVFFIAWIAFGFFAPRLMLSRSVATSQTVF